MEADALTGRSTAQDSYQPFPPGFAPTKTCYPEERPRTPVAFDGTSTSRASYLAWPMPKKYHRVKPTGVMALDYGKAEAFPTSS